MFNLGYKQIVINSDAVVTNIQADGVTAGTGAAGEFIVVEGYGRFKIPTIAEAGVVTAATRSFAKPSVQPVLGVYDTAIVVPATVGKIYSVKLYITGQSLNPRIIPEEDILVFQSAAVTTTDTLGTALAAGQLAGFNDEIVKFLDSSTTPGAVQILMQEGFAGVTVDHIEVTDDAGITTGYSVVGIGAPSDEGSGLGKLIEAEVRNATFDNIDPYGIQFGGNTPVDVRGTYRTIFWTTTEDHGAFESHQMLGYGDANTETMYAPREYIAYVNEASATGAITMLDLLVSGA